jgi:hypothetical protein
MQSVRNLLLCCTVIVLISRAVNAQNYVASPASTVVPRLVNFSGKASNGEAKPITGTVGITFSIYSAQQGGVPLWMETQNVRLDAKGNYTVQLGATTSDGLPLDLFASGEARWLGVRINGGEEQPRVLLLSVPYALKAADAQTLGGLPASAFALATSSGSSSAPATTEPSPSAGSDQPPPIGGGGLENYIPIWADNNDDLSNSILYQSGTGPGAKIGVNITKPLFTLDVNGQELVRGLFEMATTNYASKTKGYNSQPLNFESSAFSSGTGSYTLNHFQWQAEPTGNNTTTPEATLNLLYGTDPNQPAETGLNIASGGQITFAKGQVFPGTIAGITTAAGSGLSGGGTSGNLSLSLMNTCAKNQVLQWNGSAWTCSSTGTGTITGVTAGTGLSGGGTSGSVTLANTGLLGLNAGSGISVGSGQTPTVSVTGVPLLAGNNTFTGNNSFNGTLGVQNIASVFEGLGFYTNGSQQMVITGGGFVGIGTTAPTYQLEVVSPSFSSSTVGAYGWSGPAGSGQWGGDGVVSIGGSGDPDTTTNGGTGVVGLGNSGAVNGADGGGVQASGGTGTRYGDGIYAFAGSGNAGSFTGDVSVTGIVSKAGGNFKIDHPLDPANKYLYHSFVESPDMMNIYNGVATLDANGEATIQMPDWFSVLNRDFRYQLTCIGGFAPVYIAEELANNRFKIGGGRTGMRVSWQITGVRQDAWANAHRIPVEEEKEARLKGFYIHPELYGAPPEKQIEWARHPEMMKRMQEARQRMKEKQSPRSQSAALGPRAN